MFPSYGFVTSRSTVAARVQLVDFDHFVIHQQGFDVFRDVTFVA